MTYLVTGVAGFIGSHLTERLLKDGHKVIGVDNFITGTQSNIDLLNSLNGDFTFLEADITDRQAFRRAFEKGDIDCVFHQAALGSVPRSIEFPGQTFHNNCGGFQILLELISEYSVKKLVYASSSSVYGSVHNRVEDMECDPLSPYASSKLTNEVQASAWCKTFGLSAVGLRYFNVFGPRQNPNGPYAAVIPKWIGAMINSGVLEVYGDGTQCRDFTYVADAVSANILASTKMIEGRHDVFNISGNNYCDLRHLIFELTKAGFCQKPVQIKFSPARPGDVERARNASNRAKELLHFEPKYSLEKGLMEMKCHYGLA